MNRKPKYSTKLSNVTTDAVILPHNDWKRVKRTATRLTPTQRAEIARKQEEEKTKTMKQIQTKRSKMFTSSIAPETFSNTHKKLDSYEDKDYALQIAETKANEDLDEIKHIKSQMAAAEARTICDQQLHEHELARQREKEEKEQWDKKLEENRQAAVHLYEERERILREQRIRGRDVIKAQIEEKKINSILEAERRDRENKALAEQNALIAEEDRQIALMRRRQQQDFLHDCLQANEAQKQRRIAERQREKDEAQMVIDFQAEKALREERIEQEKAAQRALKEREIAEIQRKQKRAIDMQSIRDEMMAERVQEERNRIQNEREEAEHKKAENDRMQTMRDRKMMIEAKRLKAIDRKTRWAKSAKEQKKTYNPKAGMHVKAKRTILGRVCRKQKYRKS
ncbi:cilia- and flagella-associated protein [Histomonas meleagridis]|nr:cilia- and flagella-associated protein [Histomonas meleagridis]